VFKEYIDIPISEEDIEDFVKELDPNGQGFISYGTLAHEYDQILLEWATRIRLQGNCFTT
jgi:hypothetical protein